MYKISNENFFNTTSNMLTGLQKSLDIIDGNIVSYKSMLTSVQMEIETSSNAKIEMSMLEYQAYIKIEIQNMPFHSTRPFDEETIKITDSGWNKMKNDPEHEKFILDMIRNGRQLADPFFETGSVGTYWILSFDDKQGCQSHGFSKMFGGNRDAAKAMFEAESQGSFITCKAECANESDDIVQNLQRVKKPDNNEEDFWTLRHKRMEKMLEIQQDMDEKYYQLKEISERKAMSKIVQAKADGLVDTSNPMQIISGVPASLLLSILTPTSNDV